MRVSGQAGSLLLAGLETPLASVGDDGTIVTRAAGARAAYRLAVQPAGSERYREDPWRHGWSIEPFLTAAVPGYGRSTMPSFGSLIQTSDPGAIILGMEPQPDYSVIVYVQELLGFSRTVAVRSGIVRFSEARLSDLVGRDRAPFEVANGEVRFDLRARSVAAIKLLNPRVEAA
jgi:hypothetical protein